MAENAQPARNAVAQQVEQASTKQRRRAQRRRDEVQGQASRVQPRQDPRNAVTPPALKQVLGA